MVEIDAIVGIDFSGGVAYLKACIFESDYGYRHFDAIHSAGAPQHRICITAYTHRVPNGMPGCHFIVFDYRWGWGACKIKTEGLPVREAPLLLVGYRVCLCYAEVFADDINFGISPIIFCIVVGGAIERVVHFDVEFDFGLGA